MRALVASPKLHTAKRPRRSSRAIELFGFGFLEFHGGLDAGDTIPGAVEFSQRECQPTPNDEALRGRAKTANWPTASISLSGSPAV
jgi:hypothetical protein